MSISWDSPKESAGFSWPLPLRRQDLAVSLAHKAAQAEAEEAAKLKATKSAEQQAVARQHKNAFCFCMPYGQT